METLKVVWQVEKMDFTRAGEGSSKIKKMLHQFSIRPDIMRRVAIISYEAEVNLVIHSFGGVLQGEVFPDKVVVTAKDKGPGIEDLSKAMKAGFSTAPLEVRELGFGAGMGLPNIKRSADKLDLQSSEEEGTELVATVYLS
ncbi:anti-sigma regulatory factor [Proteinivorax tanatarense]|uniref:Anti-sigma regulatory factor n=1 Tax=Proteinivorax tanatarense TaxID=1260629 RepID=A0AAU7VID3_9FIRM